VRGARQVERCQRRVAMESQRRVGARLAVTQPGALFALAEQKLDLEPRPLQCHQLAAVQGQSRGGQHDVAWLGWGFPVDHDHEAQLAFERDMPDDGRRQRQMVRLRQGTEGLKAAAVVNIDFAIILTPRPTARGVRAGVEQSTVSVAPQLGHGVQVETDSCIKVLLLGTVPVHTMRGDLRRQAMTLLTQLLPGKINAGLFLGLRRAHLVIAWGCLCHRAGEGAAACHLHDSQRGDFQATFGTGGTAIEEVPQPERLLATLRDKGSILRRDDFRARVEGDRDDPLMEVRPVKAAPELPCNRALTIVAVAAQIAKVDATSQGQNGSEQSFQELGLGFTDRRHLV